MKGLLCLIFQGFLLYETCAWQVTIPREIHGLEGSCLVIPCSFSYTSYPPTDPNRVVWYQWASRGYPLVYDPRNEREVITKFRGKTELYGDSSKRNCSLLIKGVDSSHNGEKLYAWIDPENVKSSTYKFYDITSTIVVNASAHQPIINISGGAKIGDSITVVCYTFHTCPYNSKPNINLKGIDGTDRTEDVHIHKGIWKITLTRTSVVKTERTDIECTVTHYGGITAMATKNVNSECVLSSIDIEPKLADLTEGVEKNFTCTVQHSCKNNLPSISWKYKNMPVRNGNKKRTEIITDTFSTITLLGAMKDNGNKLTCTAKYSGKDLTASADLRVQQPSEKVTQVQHKPVSQKDPDVMTFHLSNFGIYIIAAAVALPLILIIAGVIIYKRCNRPSPVDSQDLQPKKRPSPVDAQDLPSKEMQNELYGTAAGKTNSRKSLRKSCPIDDYEDYYANMEKNGVYGNV